MCGKPVNPANVSLRARPLTSNRLASTSSLWIRVHQCEACGEQTAWQQKLTFFGRACRVARWAGFVVGVYLFFLAVGSLIELRQLLILIPGVAMALVIPYAVAWMIYGGLVWAGNLVGLPQSGSYAVPVPKRLDQLHHPPAGWLAEVPGLVRLLFWMLVAGLLWLLLVLPVV